jgi:hypothetical protein
MVQPIPDYATLNAAEIISTAERLTRRISERFPDFGLAKVATRLVEVARHTEAEARRLATPNIPIRIAVGLVILSGAFAFLFLVAALRPTDVDAEVIPLVQAAESTMNIAILVGLGVIGLTQLEWRWKRRHALAALHKLRSLAHVIDMHQLTKDPGGERRADPTASSPQRNLSQAQLERYLDYCSEMLALIGKLSALYAQSHNDQLVGQAVNEIEVLTTNLARKIWQKIAIIAQTPRERA